MVGILQSFSSSSDFRMELHRDTRLRRHFKERYDFRVNQIDWDYQMQVSTAAKIIHWVHYKDWRLGGVAFEWRFEKYSVPNRTMGSYLPAKHKGH